MSLLWISTGGYFDCHSGESKIYHLIEVNSDYSLEISNFSKEIYTSYRFIPDPDLIDEINVELDKGKQFLFKELVYIGDERVYSFGMYFKNDIDDMGEYQYKYFTPEINEIIYKNLTHLTFDTCLSVLPTTE